MCERAPRDTAAHGKSSNEQPHPLDMLFLWVWSRAIRSPVEQQELQDLINLISNLYLSSGNDSWECIIDDSRLFTVKGSKSSSGGTFIPSQA
ncbi:hypothetical protein Tco_1199090 [Tanacetum coccineum]